MLTINQILLFWLIIDAPFLLSRLILAAKFRKRIKKQQPFVSILVPAYNEGICIQKTLRSCVRQTYKKFEILVIDDGSTDDTAQRVTQFIEKHSAQNSIKIKLLQQKNKGKAKALNHGVSKSKGSILITIDADSYLHPRAVERIISYFTSKKVGAVAGNIIGVSRNKLLGTVQRIEYEIGMYVMRKAQSEINSVIVTPGAFSAYRISALKKFEEGTLAEDFDTSVQILERGYHIVVALDALCFTQVPQTIHDLVKQRVRWHRGTLEVFAKHLEHPKSLAFWLEWLAVFIYGFYGLFAKFLSFLVIPLLLSMNETVNIGVLLGVFFVYTCCIYLIQFLMVSWETKEKNIFWLIPFFVVYYYTIILYATLAGQITGLKANRGWEKLKRFRT